MADPCGGGQQWTTTGNNGQQWATMGNNGQQWTTRDNKGQQWATVSNNGQQLATMVNKGQQKTRMDNNPQYNGQQSTDAVRQVSFEVLINLLKFAKNGVMYGNRPRLQGFQF